MLMVKELSNSSIYFSKLINKGISPLLISLLLVINSCNLSYKQSKSINQLSKFTAPFINYDGLVFLTNINLGDGGPGKTLLFDTGSNICILNTTIVEKSNYRVNRYVINTDFYGNTQRVPMIKIDSITIEGYKFFDVEAIVADLNQLFPCQNIDGIIGSNVLKRGSWTIDYESLKLSFSESSIIKNKTEGAPFKLREGLIYLDLTINDHPFKKLIFDTGFRGDVNLRSNDTIFYSDSLKYYSKLINSLHTQNTSLSIPKLTLKDPKLNQKQVNQLHILFSGNNRFIGVDLLQNNIVTIDYLSKNLFIHKPIERKYYTTKTIGLKITILNNKATVSGLLKGSAADKAGLYLGCKIVQLNNINLENITPQIRCEVESKISDMLKKESVSIKAENWNTPLTIYSQ